MSKPEDNPSGEDGLIDALKRVKQELLIPAAEYVPAIPACWDIIDRAIAAYTPRRIETGEGCVTMQNVSSRQVGHALAIVVKCRGGWRYFVRFNETGTVLTGWSLSSARLFLDEPEAIEHPDFTKTKRRLTRAGKTWAVRPIAVDHFALSQSNGVGARYGASPKGEGVSGTYAWFTAQDAARAYLNEFDVYCEIWDLVTGQQVQ